MALQDEHDAKDYHDVQGTYLEGSKVTAALKSWRAARYFPRADLQAIYHTSKDIYTLIYKAISVRHL